MPVSGDFPGGTSFAPCAPVEYALGIACGLDVSGAADETSTNTSATSITSAKMVLFLKTIAPPVLMTVKNCPVVYSITKTNFLPKTLQIFTFFGKKPEPCRIGRLAARIRKYRAIKGFHQNPYHL